MLQSKANFFSPASSSQKKSHGQRTYVLYMTYLGENSRDEIGDAWRGGSMEKPRERERSGLADEDHRARISTEELLLGSSCGIWANFPHKEAQ